MSAMISHRLTAYDLSVVQHRLRRSFPACRFVPVTNDITEIRPFRNGWQVYKSVDMQPVFLGQEQVIDYAKGRACFGSGEICVLD